MRESICDLVLEEIYYTKDLRRRQKDDTILMSLVSAYKVLTIVQSV